MPEEKQWWIVDSSGRKIGWLWPEDLEASLRAYYGISWGHNLKGEDNWAERFCDEYSVSPETMSDWMEGREPIPKSIAAVVAMMAVLKRRNMKLPILEATWLPTGSGDNFSSDLQDGIMPLGKWKSPGRKRRAKG